MRSNFCSVWFVSRRFQVLRQRAKAIRVAAGLATVIFTPFALVLFLILFLGLGGPDGSPREILRDTSRAIFRFFVRWLSGHGLRPFTLRSISGARF
jgi:hypothetical protein